MFVCPDCGYAADSPGFCTEHGTALVAAGDPLLGQVVGSYRVARMVGQGGMGKVYLAVHPSIGSRVALKVLSAECSDRPELVERFFAEARAVNVIRHENIVSVLDLSSLPDGRPYIVMEYLDGLPLSRVLERGPLQLEQAARLVSEMLDALAAAHRRGIVHRDLKPDNVFVTAGGRAKILDFGVAKLRPDVSSLSAETRTGALVGTPHYMSPEQARGKSVDARSDLYAVGLILYEAISGRRAFDADSLFDLLRLHVEQPAPTLRASRHEVPAALDAAVSRALEKQPERRFQSAEDFRHALVSALPWSSSSPGLGLAIDTTSPVFAGPGTPMGGALPPTHPGLTQSLVTAAPVQSHSGFFRWALLAAGTLVALTGIVAGVVIAWRVTRPARPAQLPPPPPSLAEAPLTPPETPGTAVAASLAGRYRIESAQNPGGVGPYTGNVVLTERATDLYSIDWNIPGSAPYHGIALRQGGVLGVAYAAGTDYGLVVYDVKGGRLQGRWALAAGNALGSEVIDGPTPLGGRYRIVDGRNPNNTRYAGNVSIQAVDAFYRVEWKTGSGAAGSYRGLGLLEHGTFVVGWNPNRGTGVVAYRVDGDRLVGRWTVPGVQGVGHETLKRQ